VTGSSGVIGCELLRLLKDTGDILAVDRVEPEERINGVEYLQADIGTDNIVKIKEFNPDIVYHLAASFERVDETPEFFAANKHDNLDAFHYILENTHPKVFVYPSSYLVYKKDIDGTLKNELYPRNLIGAVKLYCENTLKYYQKTHWTDTRIIIGRIYRSYGRGSNDIVSRWVRALLRNEQVTLCNPENKFNYIYAGDVAKSLINLANCIKSNFSTHDINARCEKMRDILHTIVCKLGIPEDTNLINLVNEIIPEMNEFHKDANFSKSVTSIYDGIEKVIGYERSKL
jgi:nucleoside-diphosphate-sugar epimerase